MLCWSFSPVLLTFHRLLLGLRRGIGWRYCCGHFLGYGHYHIRKLA